MRHLHVRSIMTIAVLALLGAFQPLHAGVIDFKKSGTSSYNSSTLFDLLRGTLTSGSPDELFTFDHEWDLNPFCGSMTTSSCRKDALSDSDDEGAKSERVRDAFLGSDLHFFQRPYRLHSDWVPRFVQTQPLLWA